MGIGVVVEESDSPVFIDPQFLVLLAGALWVFCGLLSGLSGPPVIRTEAAILFLGLGVTGAGAGVAAFLPANQGGVVLLAAIVLFTLLPVVTTGYLLVVFPGRLAPRGGR